MLARVTPLPHTVHGFVTFLLFFTPEVDVEFGVDVVAVAGVVAAADGVVAVDEGVEGPGWDLTSPQ